MESRSLTRVVLTGCFAGGMLLGAGAWARPWGDAERGFGPGRPVREEMATVLGLSDTQKKRFDEVVSNYRPELRERHEAVRTARDRLRDIVEAERFDEQNIRTAARDVAAAEEEMFVVRGRMLSELGSFLDAGQREKAAALRAVMGGFGRHKGL